MSKWRRLAGTISMSSAVVLLVAGCGDAQDDAPLSPQDQCNEVAKAECNRIYACTTPAERQAKGLIVTELECILGLAVQLGCSTATAEKICSGAQPYSATQAQACVKEANNASCAAIKANFPNTAAFAPSCGQCVPAL